MIAVLNWLGRNARWFLAVGSVVALFLPQLAAAFRPYLPWLVCMVLGLSMSRIDMADMGRNAWRPRFLKRVLGVTILLMPLTGAIYLALARLAGLAEPDANALVFLAAAPPIASAAGLCFLLGFNARMAMEVTLTATILTPVIGPIMVAVLIPEAVSISSMDLAWRLGKMVAGGLLFAIAIRSIVGPGRIQTHKSIFDGLAALGMLLFIFPLFDGVLETIISDPPRALWVLFLCAIFNLGVNVVARAATSRHPGPDSGALGLIWGNRTIAVYLAALPADPQFTLFCALYQFPMYFTALLFGARHNASHSTPPD